MVIDQLSVAMHGREIVRNVSFSMTAGIVTCLVGKNGAGKSTILRAISGLIPYHGSILYDNSDLSTWSPRSRARIISLLSQNCVIPHVTVERYVSYGRNPYISHLGAFSVNDQEHIENAILDFGLDPFRSRDVSSLSGGEFQKTRFAMMAAQDAPVVLLDEPGTHLDTEGVQTFVSFIQRLKNKNKEIICVLHDLTLAMELADQLLVLESGMLAASGSPEEIARSETLEKYLHVCRLEAKNSEGSIISIYR